MNILNLKANHKVITTYYSELNKLTNQTKGNPLKEGAVAPLFATILRHCATQAKRILIEKYTFDKGTKNIFFDGAIVDSFNLIYGVWEAKDDDDNLDREILKKFNSGYPKDNILFQSPKRAILWQNGQCVLDRDVSQSVALVDVVKTFFAYEPPVYQEWYQAVEEFKDKVKDIGNGILNLIEQERQSKNTHFISTFENFITICRDNINPNISIKAVEEMLIQHLLTERIFRKIFDNNDFTSLNIMAHEIEKVVLALVTPHGGRNIFFKPLDRFYYAIEATAKSTGSFTEKQAFLNTVYEKFFRGFSIKVADTHGIVYTPQPVVKFMVDSVEEILDREFGSSLSDKNVHILDPFVGTGNFILHIMRKLKKTSLQYKYEKELHCNEVMLLPYYIASMNIEHEYMTLTGNYKSFEGICFVDTFQLAEPEQGQFVFMTEENTERVKKQKETPIFVVIGNPPYNAYQVNENDDNKNREYPVMDKRVANTYAKDSKATLVSQLRDPYVKAIRWASDRIGEEGIIAFVTNNSFIDDLPFDGMRKHLEKHFNCLYILDLKGNVRKDSMRDGIPIGEKHTIFGLAAMVGIAITFFIKKKESKEHKIYYSSVDWQATRLEKFALLERIKTQSKLDYKQLHPDEKYNWLTDTLRPEFNKFMPMGTKTTKSAKGIAETVLFKNYSTGLMTGRDAWVYNSDRKSLSQNIQKTIDFYNQQVFKWVNRTERLLSIGSFVTYDNYNLSWSRNLKRKLAQQVVVKFDENNIRVALYRPFKKVNLFFDPTLIDERGHFTKIFPNAFTEKENRIICCTSHSQVPFSLQITNHIPDVAVGGRLTQCFPFYVYEKDGTNRRENITDWSLGQFRTQYNDTSITKWDIFYYVYGLLHHFQYKLAYAANLKREIPCIPYVKDFWAFSNAGKCLAELHLNYEDQKEYALKVQEGEGQLNWRVEKNMKLSKDKTCLIYNDFLTLANIPKEAFDYKIGNKSALHWIIDQYKIKKDPRSGIIDDPNREDEPDYIVKLIKKIVTLSLETLKIIKGMPEMVILS